MKNESKGEQVKSSSERVPVQRRSRSPVEEWFEPLRMLDELFRPSRFSALPAVDLEETENEFLVCVDLPGFSKKDIQVECSGDQLTISGELSKVENEGRQSSRRLSSFYRSFTLPAGVDPEQIRAHCKNGVLMVHIPKGETSRARQIEISEDESQEVQH